MRPRLDRGALPPCARQPPAGRRTTAELGASPDRFLPSRLGAPDHFPKREWRLRVGSDAVRGVGNLRESQAELRWQRLQVRGRAVFAPQRSGHKLRRCNLQLVGMWCGFVAPTLGADTTGQRLARDRHVAPPSSCLGFFAVGDGPGRAPRRNAAQLSARPVHDEIRTLDDANSPQAPYWW